MLSLKSLEFMEPFISLASMISIRSKAIFLLRFRICVHAIPTNELEEYQGMPMFAEVGPLVMDSEIMAKS